MSRSLRILLTCWFALIALGTLILGIVLVMAGNLIAAAIFLGIGIACGLLTDRLRPPGWRLGRPDDASSPGVKRGASESPGLDAGCRGALIVLLALPMLGTGLCGTMMTIEGLSNNPPGLFSGPVMLVPGLFFLVIAVTCLAGIVTLARWNHLGDAPTRIDPPTPTGTRRKKATRPSPRPDAADGSPNPYRSPSDG